jgi:hypothetical protein
MPLFMCALGKQKTWRCICTPLYAGYLDIRDSYQISLTKISYMLDNILAFESLVVPLSLAPLSTVLTSHVLACLALGSILHCLSNCHQALLYMLHAFYYMAC